MARVVIELDAGELSEEGVEVLARLLRLVVVSRRPSIVGSEDGEREA